MTRSGCIVFLAKLLLYSLSICYWSMKNYFSEARRPQTYLVMSSNSIRIMVGYILNHQNVVTGDDYLVFPAKILLYSLSLSCFLKMFSHFSEVKKPNTCLFMSFSSIRIMAGYMF